jgi:hypothetical protein
LPASQIVLDLSIVSILMIPVVLCIYRLQHGAYFLREV